MYCTCILPFLLCVALVFPYCHTAGILAKHSGYTVHEEALSNDHVGVVETDTAVGSFGHGEESHGDGEPGIQVGYSIGSGLRSIAQGSANQAHSAVASQHAAAGQAAFLAKNTLAQAATQAAATAHAALEGKHVLLEELQQQAAEAHKSLSRELEQLKVTQLASKLAQQAAQGANNHIAVLTAALNNAKGLAEYAEQAAQEVTNVLALQSSMVGQDKARLEHLQERLKQASIDFEATKEAALKATASAAEAQVNASKAAAHASLNLHDNTQHQQEQQQAIDAHGHGYAHH